MVYVDSMRTKFGRMVMCHMLADKSDELLTMAARIGVHRKWLQKAGTAEEHFDVCLSKRKLAIANGAVEINSRRIVGIIQNKRGAHMFTDAGVSRKHL